MWHISGLHRLAHCVAHIRVREISTLCGIYQGYREWHTIWHISVLLILARYLCNTDLENNTANTLLEQKFANVGLSIVSIVSIVSTERQLIQVNSIQ